MCCCRYTLSNPWLRRWCAPRGTRWIILRSIGGVKVRPRIRPRIRPHLLTNDSAASGWNVHKGQGSVEIFVSSSGQCRHARLYALVRNEIAKPRALFSKVLKRHTQSPRVITVDKCSISKSHWNVESRWNFVWNNRTTQAKYLNNIVEQDHRAIKRMTRAGMRFNSFNTARAFLKRVWGNEYGS